MILSIEDNVDVESFSAAELKGLIMDSVDEVSGLSSYCVTGGIVNAQTTLLNALNYVPSNTYSQYDSVYHIVQPTYGEAYLELHQWVQSFGGLSTKAIKPPISSAYVCENCGATKMGI